MGTTNIIEVPQQLMMCVTLLATTNSRSWAASSSPMKTPSFIFTAPRISYPSWFAPPAAGGCITSQGRSKHTNEQDFLALVRGCIGSSQKMRFLPRNAVVGSEASKSNCGGGSLLRSRYKTRLRGGVSFGRAKSMCLLPPPVPLDSRSFAPCGHQQYRERDSRNRQSSKNLE